jgi:hypothetical protein
VEKCAESGSPRSRPKLLTLFTTFRGKNEKLPSFVDRDGRRRGGYSCCAGTNACAWLTTDGFRKQQHWKRSNALSPGKDVGSKKKAMARKERPLVNCDKNGVILKGYDPVAYFTQNRAVKGNPKSRWHLTPRPSASNSGGML